MVYIFDASTHSTVTVCKHCGWRTVTNTTAQAIAQARAHTHIAHPSDTPSHIQLSQRAQRITRKG